MRPSDANRIYLIVNVTELFFIVNASRKRDLSVKELITVEADKHRKQKLKSKGELDKAITDE